MGNLTIDASAPEYFERVDWETVASWLPDSALSDAGLERSRCSIVRINNSYNLKDSTLKFLLTDNIGQPAAMLKVASEIDPDCISRSNAIARSIQNQLPASHSRHILQPLFEDRFENRSLAVYPYLHKLSNSRFRWIWQRHQLRHGVLKFSDAITRNTAYDASADEIEDYYLNSLNQIIQSAPVLEPFAPTAKRAMDDIQSGRMKVKLVAMHGDIWKNNLMLDRDNMLGFDVSEPMARFVFIDWDTASLEGYPFFDLLRLSHSLKCPKRLIRSMVDRQCTFLGSRPEDVAIYVAAALGSILLNLNYCPMSVLEDAARMYARELTSIGLLSA